MNMYQVYVVCSNCDFQGEVSIAKGNPVSEFPCPTCELSRLQVSKEAMEIKRRARKV